MEVSDWSRLEEPKSSEVSGATGASGVSGASGASWGKSRKWGEWGKWGNFCKWVKWRKWDTSSTIPPSRNTPKLVAKSAYVAEKLAHFQETYDLDKNSCRFSQTSAA